MLWHYTTLCSASEFTQSLLMCPKFSQALVMVSVFWNDATLCLNRKRAGENAFTHPQRSIEPAPTQHHS
jgi:hypothetical protein